MPRSGPDMGLCARASDPQNGFRPSRFPFESTPRTILSLIPLGFRFGFPWVPFGTVFDRSAPPSAHGFARLGAQGLGGLGCAALGDGLASRPRGLESERFGAGLGDAGGGGLELADGEFGGVWVGRIGGWLGVGGAWAGRAGWGWICLEDTPIAKGTLPGPFDKRRRYTRVKVDDSIPLGSKGDD